MSEREASKQFDAIIISLHQECHVAAASEKKKERTTLSREVKIVWIASPVAIRTSKS
jgi:hypothetical protein